MGCYINPKNNISKEEWLQENARRVESFPRNWGDIPDNDIYCVWLNNGPFTACAVIYSESELEYFREDLETEDRPFKIYVAKFDDLIDVSDLLNFSK